MIAKQLAFVCCVSLLHFCIGVVWQPVTFPGSKACRWGKTWVCDPDSVISKSDVDQLDTLLQAISEKTNSTCTGTKFKGYDVRVAVAGKIEMHSPVEASTEAFANFFRKKTWKLSTSSSSCDDSVLVMLFKDVRYLQISIGDRAEKLIPKEDVKAIKGKAKEDLAAGRFALSLRKTLKELYHRLSNQLRLSKKPRLQKSPIAMAQRGGSSSSSSRRRSSSSSGRRRSFSSGRRRSFSSGRRRRRGASVSKG